MLGFAITIVVLVWIAYSVSSPQPTSTTTRSTLTSASSQPVALAINGTSFKMYVRRDPTASRYFVDVELDLYHNLQIRVPFHNASVTLLNITTSDGAQRKENVTSWVTTPDYLGPLESYHLCSEIGPLFELPKGATIRITIYIQDPTSASPSNVIMIPRDYTILNMPLSTTTSTCT